MPPPGETGKFDIPDSSGQTGRDEKDILWQRFISGIFIPDTLPASVVAAVLEGERDQISRRALIAAEGVARRSAGSIRPDQGREFAQLPEGPKRRAAYLKLGPILQAAEQPALKQWAKESGLLLDRAEFDRKWIEDGRRGESEHEVYYDASTQTWWKRNLLNFHLDTLEYLQRLALHAYLFPDTAAEFRGFMEMADGLVVPVVEQGHEKGRGTTEREMHKLLADAGFKEKHGKDGKRLGYSLEPLGIWIEDVHEDNAFTKSDGSIAVIDPVIFLNQESKMRRLREWFGESVQEK